MRGVKLLATTGIACLLAACGGGGGGGGVSPVPAPPTSAPAPTPSPSPTPSPAPANTSFADKLVSQNFASDGAASNVAFNLTSNNTITGTSAGSSLAISYNAQSDSYTMSSAGQSQTFAAADIQGTPGEEVVYRKVDGASRDNLTLVSVPFTGTLPTQYVRLGFWQRNNVADARQDTLFSAFTYGFTTPAAAMPRTGTMSFDIDVFGLSAFPGFEPRSFQGRGRFDVDLAAGVFSSNTFLTETALVSGNGVTGGGIELDAAGRLSSSDGRFSGNMVFGGTNGRIGGSLSGRFYGPNADELGAAFSGAKSDGAVVTGAFTGQRKSTDAPINLTLTELRRTERFFTGGTLLTVTSGGVQPGIDPRVMPTIGSLEDRTSGNIQFGPGLSNLPGGDYTTTSIVTSTDPNFTAYEKTITGQATRLELYKPGSANRELALTYVSFGRYRTTEQSGVNYDYRQFFTYGLETPAGLLTGRTGSGRYNGVVYGAAANRRDGARYDVSGTSQFDVNFSNQSYTGTLTLRGVSNNGAANVDFGSFEFGGQLPSFTPAFETGLRVGGGPVGTISSRFFGPDGEEIGSQFSAIMPDGAPGAGTNIAGITVAKRP